MSLPETDLPHRVERDIAYMAIPGYRPLTLDVHLPVPVSRPAPVVLFIHGGGWMVGTRSQFCLFPPAETFGRLVREGWAVVSIDYRLSSEAVFPAQIDDVRSALAWIRSNATDYGLDAQSVAVWGESAGGHLAALLALEPDAGLIAAVDWYGPSDLSDLPALPTMAGPPTREARLLGARAADEPALARQASPLHQVVAGAPPFLIAHGEADDAVPPSHSTLLAAALRTQGVQVELQLVPGAGHIWADLDDSATVMDPAMQFLHDALARSGHAVDA